MSDTLTEQARPERPRNREYWAGTACGSIHTTAPPETKQFYAEADAFRYRVEPVSQFARFADAAGRNVLEIGTGMGADLSRFLRAGARAVGIDLSPTAIRATSRRLELWDLPSHIVRADALALPFDQDSFDLVWSWGVLHHTGNIQRAVDEVFRVLKDGGRIRLMLYHRPSWVAIAAWLRWGLLRGRLKGLKEIVSDHVQAGALALTRSEIAALLHRFEGVTIQVIGTHWDKKFVPGLGRLGGSRLGWFALIEGRKPDRSSRDAG